MPRRARIVVACLVALTGSAAGVSSEALAADAVYWPNWGADRISFANLDSSAGGDLNTSGATVSHPVSVAVNAAAGKIYWPNFDANKISFANLDGSGGGDLTTNGATVSGPAGVAIDPAARRIYWPNFEANKISFANLNGTGGGDLTTTGATVSAPGGVAVDPAAGRIYWANVVANKISFANLNGTGGGDLATTGATVNGPFGVAVDPAGERIYWANRVANKISFANLDGSGGGDLNTTGATVGNPYGVALDPPAGRIYWTNPNGNKVSFARLDGTGGSDLATLAATVDTPLSPALLKAPAGAGAPAISGGSTPGSAITCSRGIWATDLLAAFLFRAPASFAYHWSLDGADIGGATASTYTAPAPGAYRCRVTAANRAGSASQTSAPHTVSAPPAGSSSPSAAQPAGASAWPTPSFRARTRVVLRLTTPRIRRYARLRVRVTNGNSFPVTGRLRACPMAASSAACNGRIGLGPEPFTLAGDAHKTVALRLPRPLRRHLERGHGLSLLLKAKVIDPAGNKRIVTRKVTPRPMELSR